MLTAATTIIGGHVNWGAVAKMVAKIRTKAINSPDVLSTFTDELVTYNGLIKPIAPYLIRPVQEKASIVQNFRKKEAKNGEVLLSLPPSDPSELDLLESTKSNR